MSVILKAFVPLCLGGQNTSHLNAHVWGTDFRQIGDGQELWFVGARQAGEDFRVVRELWFDCLDLTLVSTLEMPHLTRPFHLTRSVQTSYPLGAP